MLAVQLHNNRYHTEMAAALTEGALDLSKTSDSRPDSKASSPVPSMNSDIDSQQALDHQDRSESVPSDGNETDSSTGPAVKAISAYPKLSASHQFTTEMLSAAAVAAAAAGGGAGLPPSLRPFKMYPMEPGNNMYPGMPAVPTLSPELSLSQLSPGATLGPMAMMDPNIGISCSPIAQYIQQRKRRADRSLPTALDEDLKKSKIVPEDQKDEHYWERRRKNNDAAKRSRDARRRKEEEIALRAAFLEQENLKLRAQVAILKNETAKLHYMLYNRM